MLLEFALSSFGDGELQNCGCGGGRERSLYFVLIFVSFYQEKESPGRGGLIIIPNESSVSTFRV